MSNVQTVQDLLTKVVEGERTVFSMVTKLCEGDDGGDKAEPTLVIERQLLAPVRQEPPRRAESPRRAHVFHAVEGFVDYLRDWGEPGRVVIYADAQAQVVHAVLHEGASDGYEVVKLAPQIHPRWKPWRELAGKTLRLQDLVSFLRHNRRAIQHPSGQELLAALTQVKANTQVELNVGQGNDSINGILVKNTIKGNEKTDMATLPERILLLTPIFVDRDPRNIELDLVLDCTPDGRGVLASLASADIAEAEISEFEDMVERLRAARDGTGEGGMPPTRWTITFGQPKHQPWEYLDPAAQA